MKTFLMIPAELVDPVNRLSRRTILRLKEGLALWKEGGHIAIVVSGGLYMDPERQTVASAVLMRSWLVRYGVHPDDIIVEARSRDTYENVFMSLEGVRRAYACTDPEMTVVSHPTHLRRFRATFRAWGLEPRLHPVHYRLSLKERCFEALMHVYHLLDRQGTGFIARRNRAKRISPGRRLEA